MNNSSTGKVSLYFGDLNIKLFFKSRKEVEIFFRDAENKIKAWPICQFTIPGDTVRMFFSSIKSGSASHDIFNSLKHYVSALLVSFKLIFYIESPLTLNNSQYNIYKITVIIKNELNHEYVFMNKVVLRNWLEFHGVFAKFDFLNSCIYTAGKEEFHFTNILDLNQNILTSDKELEEFSVVPYLITGHTFSENFSIFKLKMKGPYLNRGLVINLYNQSLFFNYCHNQNDYSLIVQLITEAIEMFCIVNEIAFKELASIECNIKECESTYNIEFYCKRAFQKLSPKYEIMSLSINSSKTIFECEYNEYPETLDTQSIFNDYTFSVLFKTKGCPFLGKIKSELINENIWMRNKIFKNGGFKFTKAYTKCISQLKMSSQNNFVVKGNFLVDKTEGQIIFLNKHKNKAEIELLSNSTTIHFIFCVDVIKINKHSKLVDLQNILAENNNFGLNSLALIRFKGWFKKPTKNNFVEFVYQVSFKNTFRFCKQQWYASYKGIWHKIDRDIAGTLFENIITNVFAFLENTELFKVLGAFELKFMQAKSLKKLMKLVSTKCADNAFLLRLDSNWQLLQFKNTSYDLKSKSTTEISPEDEIEKCYPYALVDKRRKEVLDFFSILFPNKKEKEFVLNMLASTLDDTIMNDKIYFFIEQPLNGKFIIFDLLKAALSPRLCLLPTNFFHTDVDSKYSTMLYLKEIKVGLLRNHSFDKFQANIFEIYTDQKLKIFDKKTGNTFPFKTKFIISSNEIPKFDNTDEAFTKKIVVIQFDSNIINLEQKIIDSEFYKNIEDLTFLASFMSLLISRHSLLTSDPIEVPERFKFREE